MRFSGVFAASLDVAGCGPMGQQGPSWVLLGWLDSGCLGEPGVQPLADFLRRIGAAAALITGDHRPRSGHACKGRQSQHFPPAHLLRLDRARREHRRG